MVKKKHTLIQFI